MEKEKAYYVKITPENQVFKVPEQAIQNIRKDKNYFLKEKTPKLNKGNSSTLGSNCHCEERQR